MNRQTYFITGASQGLGKEMALKLIREGKNVVGTSRKISNFKEDLTGNSNFLGVEVDLLSERSISKAVNKGIDRFKSIDVLINNAGYAQFGAIEDLSHEEIKSNFEINVFGVINTLKSVLPTMRENKNGHIINISSIGGFIGSFPGCSIYCSTKFAVAGLTEGLREDVREFGINVSLVYPGYFRTNFLKPTSMKTSKKEVSEYKDAQKMIKAHQDEIDSSQPGDPKKFADVIFSISKESSPPFHLFLGSDSTKYAEEKMNNISNELASNRSLSLSTDI